MCGSKAAEGFGPHVQEGRVEASEHRDARRDDGGLDRGHHSQRPQGRASRFLQLDQQVQG